jgi:hypothetical protein
MPAQSESMVRMRRRLGLSKMLQPSALARRAGQPPGEPLVGFRGLWADAGA